MKELLKPDVQEIADIDPPEHDFDYNRRLLGDLLNIGEIMKSFSTDPYVVSLMEDADLKEIAEGAPEDMRQVYLDEIARRTPKAPKETP